MRSPFLFFALTALLSANLSAATVADWQFTDLTDSNGNSHPLTNGNSTASLSGGQVHFASDSASGLLSAADAPVWDNITFTIEAIFTYTVPSGGGIATIAAHLSSAGGRQWLLGVTAAQVPYVLLGGTSEVGYNSAFGALTDGNTYYFGAAVDLSAGLAADRLTLYVRDITNSGALHTTNPSSTLTSLIESSAPLTIGSTGHSSSRFVGSIDQVKISDTKLASNALLVVPEPSHLLLSLSGLAVLALRRRRA